MRNCDHSTDQYKKSYWGADGCAEKTTRSPGLPDWTVFHYDHGDALFMERDSQLPFDSFSLSLNKMSCIVQKRLF